MKKASKSAVILLALIVGGGRLHGQSGVFDRVGIIPGHGSHGSLPEESIDLFTGNVTLRYRDVFLPGPNGLDVEVWRVYNSKILKDWQSGPPGVQAYQHSWVGIGWTMHMGMVHAYNSSAPVIEFPDGRLETAFPDKYSSGKYITRDFLRYDKGTPPLIPPKLYFQDGVIWTFGATRTITRADGTPDPVRLVTKIENSYGQSITIQYNVSSPTISTITDGFGRVITFVSSGTPRKLTQIRYLYKAGQYRTCTYSVGLFPNGYTKLNSFTPPCLPATVFEYTSGAADDWELTSVTTSFGGVLSYTYGDHAFYFNGTMLNSRVLSQKQVRFDPDDEDESVWIYRYPDYNGSVTGTVHVQGPEYDTDVTYNSYDPLCPWKLGRIKGLEYGDGSLSETFEWTFQEISNQTWSVLGTNMGTAKGPLLSSVLREKAGNSSLKEEYQYDDMPAYKRYGLPWKILNYVNGSPSPLNYRTTSYYFSSHSSYEQRYLLSLPGIQQEYFGDGTKLREKLIDYYEETGKWGAVSRVRVLKNGTAQEYNEWNHNFLPLDPQAIGLQITVVGPDGYHQKTTYEYGVKKAEQVGETTLVTGDISEYDSSVLGIGNRSGAEVYFSYDELGRVWNENWPDDRNDKTTTWRPNGENCAVTTWDENTVNRYWDGMGRDTGYTETGDNVTLHYRKTLDAEGRVIASSAGSIDPDPQTRFETHFVMNAAGEITQITDPVGRVTNIELSGSTKTVRDPRTNATALEYDHLPGLPTRVTDAQGHVTINTYDDAGRLLTVNYNNGARWHSFEYDRADNVLAETHPETGRIEYEYTVENWLLRKSWGGAVIQHSHRTDNGQLVSVTIGDGTYEGREENITYLYDEHARVQRIRSTFNGWSREDILYDQYGNVTSETIMIPGLSPKTITYDYDRNNNLKRTTYPDQNWAETTSNGLNMPESVAFSHSGNLIVSQASYGHAKAVTGLSFGRNGTQYQASYLGSGELNAASLNKAGATLYDASYTYDGAGNVLSISSSAPVAMNASFGYDALNRLTSAAYSSGAHLTYSYGYDEYGNMRTVHKDGVLAFDKTYNSQNRAIGDSYDSRGNLISVEGKNFYWNKYNQLAYVTDFSGGLLGRYLYDERGLRIRSLPPLPEIDIECGSEEVPDGGEVHFESEVGQHVDKTFTIENPGEAALTLYGSPVVTIVGADSDQFSVQLQPTSPVPPNGSTTFTIRFEPTSYGSKAALIVVSNDDPDESAYEINLIGNPNPEIYIPQAPDGGTWDFGSVPRGESVEQVFVIENQGKANLILSGNPPVLISGDSYNQFVVTEQPETIVLPGCETTFTVTYLALRLGQSYAQLSIVNNDPDESPYNITLTGYGEDGMRGDAGGGEFNITSPDGGEALLAGSVHLITWTGGELCPYVNLEYSADNGSTFRPIAERAENTGFYHWQVPTDLSPSCLVRISDPDGPAAAARTLAFGFNLKMSAASIEDGMEAPLVIRASLPDPESQVTLVAELAFSFDALGPYEKVIFNYAESVRQGLALFSVNWHHVRITFDLEDLTGSVLIDGLPYMQKIPLIRTPLSGTVPEIAVFRSGDEAAGVWMDDLEVVFEDVTVGPAADGTWPIKPIVTDRFDRYVSGIFPSQGGWAVSMALPQAAPGEGQAAVVPVPYQGSDLAAIDGSEFISPFGSLVLRRSEEGPIPIVKSISLPERTPYDVSLSNFAIVSELAQSSLEDAPSEYEEKDETTESGAAVQPQAITQAADNLGEAVRTLSSGSRGVFYIYSFDGRLLAEYDIFGVCQRDYIYVGNRLVAEYQPSLSQYHHYTQDHVRSTRVVTDDAGAVVYAESYDPYGGVQQTWPGSSFEPKRKFSDKERDEESGLDYFGARYYSSSHYRFVTVDPVVNKKGALAIPQLFNLYAYCMNNPTTYVDPDGLDIYIFYDPFNFSIQAMVEENMLRKKFPNEPIHRIGITTEEEFLKAWNSMANATYVTLIFHSGRGDAGPTTISIRASNREYLTTNPNRVTPSGVDATYIGELEKKSFKKLVLYVCHAADPKATDNIANTFFITQDVKAVKASPGNVNFNNPWLFQLPAYAPKSSVKWIFIRR